jgi:N-acylneuraminate cytidylyltransferase
MSGIAIIPARSGSKRILNKNIRNFQGAPIISYPITTAIESGLFSQVYVSTDSPEIADIARSYGAVVPWLRDKILSSDTASTLSVLADEIRKHQLIGEEPRNICCIYPTTPLLSAEYLKNGLLKLISGDWDYVISVTKNVFKPQRILTLDSTQQIQMLLPHFEQVRTQDLSESYSDAGQFYWGTSDAWLKSLPIFTSKSTIIELSAASSVDLDTEEDWLRAEEIFKSMNKKANASLF